LTFEFTSRNNPESPEIKEHKEQDNLLSSSGAACGARTCRLLVLLASSPRKCDAGCFEPAALAIERTLPTTRFLLQQACVPIGGQKQRRFNSFHNDNPHNARQSKETIERSCRLVVANTAVFARTRGAEPNPCTIAAAHLQARLLLATASAM
jgi:hypothetical protein